MIYLSATPSVMSRGVCATRGDGITKIAGQFLSAFVITDVTTEFLLVMGMLETHGISK